MDQRLLELVKAACWLRTIETLGTDLGVRDEFRDAAVSLVCDALDAVLDDAEALRTLATARPSAN